MRLERRHRARDTANSSKLTDGRTAMKNTDAVFVRHRTGAKDAEQINGFFFNGF